MTLDILRPEGQSGHRGPAGLREHATIMLTDLTAPVSLKVTADSVPAWVSIGIRLGSAIDLLNSRVQDRPSSVVTDSRVQAGACRCRLWNDYPLPEDATPDAALAEHPRVDFGPDLVDGTAGLASLVPRVICLFERPPLNKFLIGGQYGPLQTKVPPFQLF